MQQYKFYKHDFENFFNLLSKRLDLVAPVRKYKNSTDAKESRFEKIKDSSEIYLKKLPLFPIKEFFFNKKEIIFEFVGDKISVPKLNLSQTVYFGIRQCDLNSIMKQDLVFLAEHEDPYYKARRDASILIGYYCTGNDEYCFCNSIGLKEFFDVMFYDIHKDYFGVEVGSEKGNGFIKNYGKFFHEAKGLVKPEHKKVHNSKKLSTTEITKFFDDEGWQKGSDICLSCGACNLLCPNCHCFNIVDEVEFDLKTGKRVRTPASCQLRTFTRVAGDHIFRIKRDARFKHRIYHQIQYFRDRHGITFCSGCGRCIRGCPVRIDFIKIINEMNN